MEQYIRLMTAIYVMISPFIFVVLQQNVFKDTFDDDLGSKMIARLHLISTMACVAFFLMSLGWVPPSN